MFFIHNLNGPSLHTMDKGGEKRSIFIRSLINTLVVPNVEVVKGLADVLDLEWELE